MYLEVSDRAKNLLSVQNTFEILCDNNRLSNQLLLSSEIGSFEVGHAKNPQNLWIFLCPELQLGFHSDTRGIPRMALSLSVVCRYETTVRQSKKY